jgi:predicted transcriptional regulator
MTTFTIELPDETAERLQIKARHMKTTVEALVATQAKKLSDEPLDVEQIIQDIVRDNAELYRRLA